MTNEHYDFLDRYIKLTSAEGNITILPARNEAFFLRKNNRSKHESEKFRISRPDLEEVRAHYPQEVSQFEQTLVNMPDDSEVTTKSVSTKSKVKGKGR